MAGCTWCQAHTLLGVLRCCTGWVGPAPLLRLGSDVWEAPGVGVGGAEAGSEDRDGVSAGYQAGQLVIRSSEMQFRPLDDVLHD